MITRVLGRALSLSLMCALVMIVAGGCSKSAAPAQNAPAPVIDVEKFKQAFPNPTPEIRASLDQIGFGIRYGTYDKASQELDKLANAGALTDPQKKAVADLADQIKQTQKQTTPAATQ